MTPEQYVLKYFPYAKKAEKESGVPALFAIAQSALESGWGKKTPGNMLFGVKVGSGKNFGGWKGDKQFLTTTEYSSKSTLKFPYIYPGYPKWDTKKKKYKYKVKDYFRAYPSPYYTFLDWSGLLTKASRYAKAMANKDDPNRFAEEVAKAGYATAPDYAKIVKSVIHKVETIANVHGLMIKVMKKAFSKALPLGLVIGSTVLLAVGVWRLTKHKD